MTEQTEVDPVALRKLGGVFGQTAQSVEVAALELAECDFGAHLGSRYGTHAIDYTMGILAVTRTMGALAGSSRAFGEALTGSADTLEAQDSSNAVTFSNSDRGGTGG